MRTRTPSLPARRPAVLLFLFLLLTSATAWAQPTVTGFSPASGAAGSSVVVTGTGFTSVTSVRFGELSATFVVNNTGQLTAVVPRAASTQVINVTTTAGSEISPTAFAVTRNASLTYTLAANNFAGVNFGANGNAAPAVADLDRNGRLDLLVGRADGTISRYEQTSANATTFNSLGQLTAGGVTIDRGTEATVAIVDTDSDGKFNLLVGAADGFVYDYEQTAVGSTTFVEISDFVGQISTTTDSAPSVTNLDGDGRLDLVTGKGDGIVSFAEQLGRNDPAFAVSNTNYQTVTANSAPFCVDLDGNGRVDVLIGVGTGNIYRFEQSAANNPTLTQRTSVFNSIDVGTNAKPCVTDIDGDGLLDLLIGRGDGTIDRYEQTPPPNTAPTDISLSNASVAENQAVNTAVGTLSTTDANAGDTFTYTFASGGPDNGSFNIIGNTTLTTNRVFDFETRNSYTVRLRSTDQGGLSFVKDFTITVNDVSETPTITNFTPTSGAVGTSNVVITGTNFNEAGAVTVRFNGTTATTVTVNSNTQITATVPAGATTGRITVQNADGTATSGTDFTVPLPVVLATVTTAAPTGITATSAVLGGEVTSQGNGTVTERGVVYVAGTGTPTTANTKVAIGSGLGSFSQNVTGLAAGSQYTVRAYAINGAGTAYGASSNTFVTGNTPPTAGDDSYMVAEDSGPTSFNVRANDSDPDAGTTLRVAGVTQPANGIVTFTASGVSFMPFANFDGITSFTYTLADGNGGTDTGTVTVTVAGVNDAPFLTVPGAQSTAKNAPLTFGSANNNALSVGDIDAGSNPVEVTIGVVYGTATLSTTANLTFSQGDGTADAGMTFRGRLADINIALNGLVFRPNTGYSGAASVQLTINDLGNTGGGGALSDSETIAITVVPPVNQAPVLTVPATQSTTRNTALVFSTANGNALSVADADAGSGALSVYITAGNGAVTLSTTAGLTLNGSNGSGSFGFTGTLANINAALNGLTFSPNSGFTGAAGLQLAVDDQGNTGSGGAKSDTESVTINVLAPANQAPVVTAPATQTALFNTNLTFNAANGNAVSVADADAGSGALSASITVGFGTATLSTTTGLTFTSGANGGGSFAFTGTLANINAALNGLVFRANSNYSGSASLQMTVNDQGNTGSGGAKTDSKTVAITVAPNQAPVLVAGSGSAAWLQGGGAVAVAPALTASDADSPNLFGATVSITGGFASGQDVLAFASANGIAGSYAAGTGVLTLSGTSSVANYQAALRSITYNNSAGTPTAGTRTISFVASDGSLNSAAVTRTVTVAVRPNTTITSGPGAITNNSTVSFVFSSDQSPVLYETTGNPVFAFPSNGANSNFGPVPDGTYTLSVAARNTNNGLTDPSPATYTFTVDTQRPTPVISSAVASGATTTTSPIPFTITFSENVTGFSLAEITVSGGTKGNFVAVSATQYTFDLTPGAPGTFTVNVAANVANDAATNPNLAATQYGVTYALPATAAPTVSYPTNGSTIASTTPTYTGTAVAGSLVTVFVDNTSIGTTTAAAGGSWSLLQPTALTQAIHTVKATAQRSGAAVSGFSNVVSFTVDVTAPSVPTVSNPADGSFIGTLRPAYSGTGAGGSIITVYVDNTSIGTTTIAAGASTWSLTQPTDLAQGAHTVKVTATDGVGNVSAFSATNTFTVDTVVPTVAVSSPVGASGSTTATSPVPFTITFNEPVANFVLTDITVSGGTPGSFVVVNASQYTFSVTPAVAGTITVSVAAGVTQDRAGNNNTASPGPAFSLNYQPRPTITSLSAAAELPGMPVVVTGAGFTSASTATVGGVAASVTYTSATSLTITVPATAPVGSTTLVVTTNGVPSTSAPAFSVLKVYDTVASCLSTASYVTTGDNQWHYLLAGGQVVAALRDTDADLGTVSLEFRATGSAGAVRQDPRGRSYLDRNFHLTASGGTFAGSSVEVRFYGLVSELARLTAADPAATLATLKATQYSGPNEDCDLGNNNSTIGEARTLGLAARTPGNGVAWFVAQATVPDHFSEFYLTGSSAPLPVELSAFTAEAQGRTVRLAWATASEKNSQAFEIERSLDGRTFERIGTVAAAGNSSSARSYELLDTNPPIHQSTLYYRLRQVDRDGTFAYSPVRSVQLTSSPVHQLAIFPNPAHGGAATLTGAVPGMAVTVVDALGRVVAQATAAADGTARLNLPAGLATGVYAVRGGGQTLRLVVE